MTKKRILMFLNHQDLKLGSVESLTGGMFASSVVDIAGASATFKGALVTYTNEMKHQLALVEQETMDTYGVISSKTAIEMAKGGQRQLGVDYCMSFTGNAGPGTLEGRPVGDVYIALTIKDDCIVEHFTLEGSRNDIRKAAVAKGWEMLERVIKERNANYL